MNGDGYIGESGPELMTFPAGGRIVTVAATASTAHTWRGCTSCQGRGYNGDPRSRVVCMHCWGNGGWFYQ